MPNITITVDDRLYRAIPPCYSGVYVSDTPEQPG